MDIIVGTLIVTLVGGIAFASRANWGAHMGQNLGREYMKEFGIGEEPTNYNQKSGEGEKRE